MPPWPVRARLFTALMRLVVEANNEANLVQCGDPLVDRLTDQWLEVKEARRVYTG